MWICCLIGCKREKRDGQEKDKSGLGIKGVRINNQAILGPEGEALTALLVEGAT